VDGRDGTTSDQEGDLFRLHFRHEVSRTIALIGWRRHAAVPSLEKLEASIYRDITSAVGFLRAGMKKGESRNDFPEGLRREMQIVGGFVRDSAWGGCRSFVER